MVACSTAAWPPPAPPEFVNPVKATPQPWALHWAGTLGVGGGKIQEFLTRKIPNMEKWNGEEYLLFSMRKEIFFSEVLCDTTRSPRGLARVKRAVNDSDRLQHCKTWSDQEPTSHLTPLSTQLQLQMLLCLLSFNKISYWQGPTKGQTPADYTVHQPQPSLNMSH